MVIFCMALGQDCISLLLQVPVQNKNSEFCAPLTSFDWNETDPKRLGTSSIDTTCTIWDIEVGSPAFGTDIVIVHIRVNWQPDKQVLVLAC